MPLVLRLLTENDTLAWTRIRTLAYHGPLHNLVHRQPVSESSFRGVSEDRKKEIGKPDNWHWKIVDTDLPPGGDDPSDNGGRTIAIAVWSAHNLPDEKKKEGPHQKDNNDGVDHGCDEREAPFIPPELNLELLSAVLGPLRSAQAEIMGSSTPYLKLDTLATHPDHQRRGAGKILLGWGLKKADEKGWSTYLDATPAGLKAYQREGFEIKKEVTFDRAQWGGDGEDWWGCMVREAKMRP